MNDPVARSKAAAIAHTLHTDSSATALRATALEPICRGFTIEISRKGRNSHDTLICKTVL